MNDDDDNNTSYAKHFYGNICDSPLNGQNIIVSAFRCLTLRANKCI